ncbi:hypothetical protein [Flavobacterium sp. H122]|uniref:hypothetical protein n=1 Tax=Flavobacterium sp. H122 TaxID=2529860 RepID=UPI0010AAB3FE|nr:hypothetical protein [Flavobacterium sp. H122]
MKKLLPLICLFYASFSFSQQHVLPERLVKAFCPEDYTIAGDVTVKSELDKDDFYEITLDYDGEQKSFKLKPLTFPNFKAKFKRVFGEIIKAKANGNIIPSDSLVDNHIALLFSQIVTYQNSEEERPEVAKIYLKENIPVYYYKSGAVDKNFEAELTEVQVEISFFGGFIEKMQVNGKIGNTPVTFNNKYSIGISSTKNIQQLNEYRLFTGERFTETEFNQKMIPASKKIAFSNELKESKDELLKAINQYTVVNDKYKEKKAQIDSLIALKKTTKDLDVYKDLEVKIENNQISLKQIEVAQKESLGILEVKKMQFNDIEKNEKKDTVSQETNPSEDEESLMIYVSDVIRYVKKVDVNANDISPVPQLVILDQNQKETKLYREESSKLFEAVVFTDFLGVFDEENPNGIIQTEVTKRFNLNTKRGDTKWYHKLFIIPMFFEGIGFLQYFDAQFQFSKIEKSNKFLLPSVYNGIDGSGNPFSENYYSPLSLYQYRNYSIGGNLTLFFLENQNAKINGTLDTGFLFGRSGIKENVDQEDGDFLNNLEIPIEFKLQILPEKRFSFFMSDRLSWFEIFDSNINLKSIEDNKLVSKNRFLNTFNVGMNLDISSSGKLFLRYKLIHELDNINTNFSQLQFGYSFYLLQKNGLKKKD